MMKSYNPSSHTYITAILLGLLAVVQRPESACALKVVINYPNSTCADNITVAGTYELSYDEYAYADEGFSVDYYGACMYFEGGYLNLSAVDEYVDPSDYILYGRCSQCNDNAICIDPYDDATKACDAATQQQQRQQQSNSYQSNLYQSTGNSHQYASASTTSTSAEQSDPIMSFSFAMRQQVDDNQVLRIDQESIVEYYILGALVCSVTLMSLVTLAEKKRQTRSQTMVELSKKLSVVEGMVVV